VYSLLTHLILHQVHGKAPQLVHQHVDLLVRAVLQDALHHAAPVRMHGQRACLSLCGNQLSPLVKQTKKNKKK
jgi:hypothetical protein